jgi:hypothetical protein
VLAGEGARELLDLALRLGQAEVVVEHRHGAQYW